MRPFPPCDGVTHRFVDADGVRLHIAEAGRSDAPPVMLLHGWPQHWWLWREVIPALAEDFRVMAVDLRGFGWSDVTPRGYEKRQLARDMIALLDAKGIARILIAGHDWGGWTAQLMALEAPERIECLALLNIPPVWLEARRLAPVLGRLAYQLPIATPGLGPALHRSPLLPRLLTHAGIPGEAAVEFAQAMKEPGRALAASRLYRTFLIREVPALLRGALNEERLTVPTRVLFGADDQAISPRLLDGFHVHADDLEIELVKGIGHFIVDERPDLVVQFLRTWFRP
jgi:pimeloyl-ACP methyl ester carboxylesterase